jgi:glycosyltransferase involved in cell wall biosynthesis
MDPYRFVRLLMDRRTLQLAKNLSCNSPYIYDKVKRVAAGNVSLVPNMLLAEQYTCGPRTRGAGCRVLAAASWGRLKNVGALLSAFRLVRQTLPEAELLLCGDGFGPGQEAETWARAHRCTEGVRFIGYTPFSELTHLMSKVDLFVHPSLEESFGMVLVEAMAQGTPVIGGLRSGAVPYVLGDGSAGVLTEVQEPTAIAESILWLLSDADAWHRYSEAGLARARDAFHESVVLGEWERVYRNMAAR